MGLSVLLLGKLCWYDFDESSEAFNFGVGVYG
jgi:hypothetical protein